MDTTTTQAEVAAVWVDVSALHPWKNNPRINDAAVDKVAQSIKRFGFGAPLIARKADGEVIAGHTRLKAAIKLGLRQVPVRYVDLDPADAHLLALADNKTSEIAEWDDAALGKILDELRGQDIDLLDGTGFTDSEIRKLIDGATGAGAGEDPGAGEPPLNPESQPGEIYELGPHRLMCGDSTNAEHMEQLLDGEVAALLSTDPPYCVDYTGMDRPIHDGKPSGKDWSHVYREVDIKDLGVFLDGVFTAVLPHVKDDAAIYVWHAHLQQPVIAATFEKHALLLHQILVWVKPVATFGHSYYRWRHEPCAFGWRRGKKPAHGFGQMDSVWECDWEGKSRIVGNEHPTQKPLEIFQRPIRTHTNRGELVLEPFGGSGSQLIAAAIEGRRCFAMELSPAFCDVIRRRWTKYARSAGIEPGPGGLE